VRAAAESEAAPLSARAVGGRPPVRPRVRRGRKRSHARDAVIAALALVALYLLLPRVAGLEYTWQRIRDGSPRWLAAAVAFEASSFVGYVWLLRRIGRPLTWRAAWQITLAGVAATRVVTVAGAGGIAVTIDGLRRSGLSTREAAERQAVDLAVLYGVFFSLTFLDGLVLLLSGHTLALSAAPAAIAVIVIALGLAMARVPATFERALQRRLGRPGRWLGAFPSVVAAGVRGAGELMRSRDPALLGALAWWAFDVAAMWACVHAFGGSVGALELLMAYLAGHAFNILPVPGGVGPVEGGLIAALVAFGEPAGLALVAVLAYQLVSVWLPAGPGAVALARSSRASARR
jgi:uncharacterized membrane protein YbhN (UPF0104 family)